MNAGDIIFNFKGNTDDVEKKSSQLGSKVKSMSKGFLKGTQSSLDFLPEKNTDFIFTALGEENGFIGSIVIITLFFALISGLLFLSLNSKTQFGRYVCVGCAMMIFIHAFINISMVIGMVPVVGVPIPFISYGGSSLITCTAAIGIAISCCRHTNRG